MFGWEMDCALFGERGMIAASRRCCIRSEVRSVFKLRFASATGKAALCERRVQNGQTARRISVLRVGSLPPALLMMYPTLQSGGVTSKGGGLGRDRGCFHLAWKRISSTNTQMGFTSTRRGEGACDVFDSPLRIARDSCSSTTKLNTPATHYSFCVSSL